MNNLSFLLTLSYNVRLAFSLFLIFPQQHRILLLGHCCMYFILFYVFVYLICYRKKTKKLYPLQRTVESFKCNKPQCEVCINGIETDTFASTATGENFKINYKFNCDDKCLIYLLTCNQCRRQYVGQTVDSFCFRWNNFKCNYHKHAKDESVKQQHLYDHFILEDHTQFVNDALIIFIDKTDPTDPLKREQYWRHTLETLMP